MGRPLKPVESEIKTIYQKSCFMRNPKLINVLPSQREIKKWRIQRRIEKLSEITKCAKWWWSNIQILICMLPFFRTVLQNSSNFRFPSKLKKSDVRSVNFRQKYVGLLYYFLTSWLRRNLNKKKTWNNRAAVRFETSS